MRYQLFTPEPDNGVTGNPGEYQPVLEDCQVQQVALEVYNGLEHNFWYIPLEYLPTSEYTIT